MSVSTVPAVKAALFNGIKTQIADSSVLVSYDEPGEFQPDDIVVIGNVSRSVEVHAMVGSGGTGWLEETYTVDIVISVYRGGDDPQTVFERACTLAAAVETFVRNDPYLGLNASGVIVSWPIQAEYVGEWEEDHRGRMCTVNLQIHVLARI